VRCAAQGFGAVAPSGCSLLPLLRRFFFTSPHRTLPPINLPPLPPNTKVYECEQVIAYLRSLVAAGPSAAAAPAKAAEEQPAPGMKLLKKRDDDENDLVYSGGAGKKGKGAKKVAARAQAAAAGADKAKVRLWGFRGGRQGWGDAGGL
jgi:hypothetical protein